MNRKSAFSPVLLELILSIFFLALATGVVIRLVAAADEISRKSVLQSRALIAMESAVEAVKADPEGFGAFSESGVCLYTVQTDAEISLTVTVRREDAAAGTVYAIDVRADNGTLPLGTLSTARYIAGEARP